MTEIPNSISNVKTHPDFFPQWKKVGVKFEGQVIFDCFAFNRDEGWVIRPQRDKKGRIKFDKSGVRGGIALAEKQFGKVETYWRG